MTRLGGHHIPTPPLTLFTSEAALTAAGALTATAAVATRSGPASVPVALGVTAALLFALYLADLYRLPVAMVDYQRGGRLLRSLGWLALAALPVAVVADAPQRLAIFAAVIVAAAVSVGARALLPLEALRPRVFLVGDGAPFGTLVRELECREDETIVGVASPEAPNLATRVAASGAEIVVAAGRWSEGLDTALLSLRLAGIEVLGAAAYVERSRRKLSVDLLSPAALIFDDGFTPSRVGSAARRLLSLGAAALLAVAVAPVAFACAVAIRLDSPGPVLFRQERVGRLGHVFRMWKLRTMRADAEAQTGAVWAAVRDPRITRVGRFLRATRLDELPQLLNVLAGDMDVVGPRPERPEIVRGILRELPYYDLRALVRPGITGWAQISYPYGASVEDAKHKLGYDLYYVKRASPLLDAIVLFHTAKVVLTRRGAR